jgi:LytS/YehU family sensor histidine kinase
MMEAQIEPHFLFNTLATIKRLYRTEPVAGARMVARLTEYLKAALPQIRRGMPTLASEIDLVRAYLEMLKIRMGPRLAFTIDAPPSTLTTPFPAMMILTLVEKAIKHGLYDLPDGGRINVRVIDSPEMIALEVQDNGVGFHAGAGTSGSGIGLANIRARLDALYGSAARLVLMHAEPNGVVARIEIASNASRNIAGTMSGRAFFTGAGEGPLPA